MNAWFLDSELLTCLNGNLHSICKYLTFALQKLTYWLYTVIEYSKHHFMYHVFQFLSVCIFYLCRSTMQNCRLYLALRINHPQIKALLQPLPWLRKTCNKACVETL